MKMTNENKGWMAHALYIGESNMELFSEKCWQWISEPWEMTSLSHQCNFYQKYVEFAGEDTLRYSNTEALDKTIQYADDKIMDCFREIDRRFKLTEE